ncbi:MAG: rRNA pseudouridine synthase [Candidatus Aminicenantes bacterium]|nr:rRNA pseudouridine synthase [Candidatus Aminicenantes bacterium]
MRLNKFLAGRGVASRRQADRLITEGRVSVNGTVVEDLGTKIDESGDRVSVDGRTVGGRGSAVYWMLNKPAGYLVTMDDPFERRSVRELMSGLPPSVKPVGRLDKDSEGLLILTNDGDLAFRLTHPRYEVAKRYVVRVKGEVDEPAAARLRAGVFVEGRKTAPARVEVFEKSARESVLQVEIHEGRKREVRNMLQAVGHPVLALKRVMFAGLSLSHLAPGEKRPLTPPEVLRLRKAAGPR